MDFFDATNCMLKYSRKMKAENDVLPEVPAHSKGKDISEELKRTVKTFLNLMK